MFLKINFLFNIFPTSDHHHPSLFHAVDTVNKMGLNTGLVSAHLRKCDKLMIRDLIISAGGKAGVTLLNPVIKMQLLAEE